MPTIDSVPITTLERAVSTDVTNMEDLINRTLMELSATLARTAPSIVLGSAPPAPTLRPHIASGLTAYQSAGATILVRPGWLAQSVAASPPQVPTPGAFDSAYRTGLLLAIEDVGDPWNGLDRFWLLQARVERVTTLSEVRDIYNPALGTFAPSGAPLDKRYESQVVFDWKEGTATDVPTPDAGYAPIAWCFRAAGGGAITDLMVGQLSVQLEDISPQTSNVGRCLRRSYRLRMMHDGTYGIGDTGSFQFDLEAEVAGMKCFARTLASPNWVPLKAGQFVPLADQPALDIADTWGYVYLAPALNIMPSGLYPYNLEHRGCVVVSRTPPDRHGLNTVAMLLPSPLANWQVPIRGAACVGLIRSAGAGNPCRFIDVSADGVGRIELREFNSGSFPLDQANGFDGPAGPSYDLAVLGPGGTEDVPWGVTLLCFLEHTTLDAAAVAAAVEMTFCMRTGVGVGDMVTPTRYPRFLMSTDALHPAMLFELYPREGNLEMTVTFVPRTAALADSGGGAAHGGNNAFRAGMYGFRF